MKHDICRRSVANAGRSTDIIQNIMISYIHDMLKKNQLLLCISATDLKTLRDPLHCGEQFLCLRGRHLLDRSNCRSCVRRSNPCINIYYIFYEASTFPLSLTLFIQSVKRLRIRLLGMYKYISSPSRIAERQIH